MMIWTTHQESETMKLWATYDGIASGKSSCLVHTRGARLSDREAVLKEGLELLKGVHTARIADLVDVLSFDGAPLIVFSEEIVRFPVANLCETDTDGEIHLNEAFCR